VLGQDIALQLGTFAHIVALRRTKVGQITENQCISLDAVLANPVAAVLQPLTTVLDDISALAVSAEDAHRIRQGQTVVLTQTTLPDGLAYCTLDGVLIALGRIESNVFAPQRGIFL
jgi:tRNA pseudouridine55 synthase